jgi:hypothetical protein
MHGIARLVLVSVVLCYFDQVAADDTLDEYLDDDLDLDDLEDGFAAESFDLRSPKEIDEIWLKVIRENVKNKRKIGMSPGDEMHTEAENEARALGAFRPKKTKAKMGAALLAGSNGGSRISAIAGGVDPAKSGKGNASVDGGAADASKAIWLGSNSATGSTIVTQEHWEASEELGENISQWGAIAKIGGLTVNDSAREKKWGTDVLSPVSNTLRIR